MEGKSFLSRKGILLFVLVLAMLLLLYPGMSFAADPDTEWYTDALPGTGLTADHPYAISNAAELAGLAQLVNSGAETFTGKYVEINNSAGIDLSAYSDWVPVGTLANPFKGSFNGNGETISGLTIDNTETLTANQSVALGLFGCIGTGGSVQDLTLASITITVHHTIGSDNVANSYVGGIAGLNEGTVSGCTVSGNLEVDGVDIRVGGIVGKNGSDSGSAGNTYGIIEGCTVNCSIVAASSYQSAHVGSIAGGSTKEGCIIENCVSLGSVTVSGKLAYIGAYKASLNAGGIVGYADHTGITNCTSSSVITVNENCRYAYAGGVIGEAATSEIRNCSSSGTVFAHGGDNTSYSNEEIAAGGLAGRVASASVIDNCSSSGTVEAEADNANYAFAGGLAGYVKQFGGLSSISRSYATGTADATALSNGFAMSGGFCGYLWNASIEKSYSSGNASSVAATGGYASSAGFAGYAQVCTVENSYSTGDSSANCDTRERSGGFVGAIAGNTTFINCYSTGQSAVAHTGGAFFGGAFIGAAGGTCTVTNCYYDALKNETLKAIGNNIAALGSAIPLITHAMTDNGTLTADMNGLPDSVWMKRANTATEWYYPELKDFGGSSDSAVEAASRAGVTTAPVTALPMNVSNVAISYTLNAIEITMPDIGLQTGNFTVINNVTGTSVVPTGISYANGKYTLTVGSLMSYYDTYTLTITKTNYETYTDPDVYYGILAVVGDLNLIDEPNIFTSYTRALSDGVVTVSNNIYTADALIYPDSEPGSLYRKIETNNGDILTPASTNDFRAVGAFVIAPSGALGAKSLYSDGSMTKLTDDDLIDANPNFKETVASGKAANDNAYWQTIAFAPVYMKTAVKQSDSSWRLNDPADRLRIVEWYDNADCTGAPIKVVRFMMKVEYAGSIQIVPAAPTNPVQDDAGNTFGWTNAAGFASVGDYEYSVDGGSTWNNAAANPQSLPNENYAVGDIQVRVKADAAAGRAAGAILKSTIAYTEAPELTAVYAPVAGSTAVDPGDSFTLTFTENVSAVSGKYIFIKKTSDDSIAETIAANSSQVTVTGTQVTVNPSADLYYSTGYYILVDAGAFTASGSGGIYQGIAGKTTWSFTTEMRSEVTAVTSEALAHYMANPNISVINLAGGTEYAYAGGTVSRSLTVNGNGGTILAGQGVNDTVVRSDDITVSSTGLSNYANKMVFIKVEGAGNVLTLTDLTLKNGSNKNGTDTADDGIFAVVNVKTGASLYMDNVTLEDFHNNPSPGDNFSFGIHAEPAAVSTTIKDSRFESTNAFRNAVAIRGGAIQLLNNSFEGTDHPERLRQADGYEYAIYIYGGQGSVLENTISGYNSTTQLGYTSAGIAVIGFYSTEVIIEDNILSYNASGIDITGTWSPWSSNRFMKVNGQVLTSYEDAYTMGEALKEANTQDYVSVSMDQNDEVKLEDSPGHNYYSVYGGYRSPFLTLTGTTANSATVQLSTADMDALNAATAIEFEKQTDSDTNWTSAAFTWITEPAQATLSLEAGHVYRIRAKLTHKSYVETSDPVERTLVTYTNLVTVADTTAPVLSGESASGITDTTATLNFTSNEAGTYYYVVYAAGDTAPDAAAVKAQGTAAAKGTAAATAAANTANVTGLAESTAYKAYVIVEDAAGNLSAVTAIDFTTTATPDTTAPVLSGESASGITDTTATLNFTSNEAGTYYYVVYAAGDTAPDAAAVKAQGMAATKGTAAATAAANTANVTGLAESTAYKAYVIVEDASGNLSAVTAIDFTTMAAASLAHDVTGNAKVFRPLPADYVAEARDTLTVTVQSSGRNSNVTAVLNGNDASSFTLTADIGSLNEGETGTFTVTPNTGLPSGTYNATVTITSDEFPAGVSFTIQQTVSSPGDFILAAVPGSGYVQLNWTSVPEAVYYDVYIDNTYTVTVTDDVYAYRAEGLINGTSYSFEVRAVENHHTTIALSNLVIATPADVAGVPVNVTATAGNGQARISFTAPSGNGGSPITGYTVYVYRNGVKQNNLTVTGVTGSPVDVYGLTNWTAYSFTVVAVNAQGNSAESAASNEVMPYVPSGYDPGDSKSGDTTGVDVLVNGKVENAGTARTTTEGNKTVTTITLDEKKLEQRLAQEGNNAVITIPVSTNSDVVVGELNGQMVKGMENKQAVVEVKTGTATYTIPAQQINIDAISEQLGTDVKLSDISVSIAIAKASDETAKIVENSAKAGEFTIIAPPMEFTVNCSTGGKVVSITRFNAYVERTIAIPDGIDPNRITTGIVVEPDGTVRHVPTRITMIDGKYYAVINSLTNSTYSVIWHPLEFKDTENHWAKEAINDMGSRMVINGIGDGMFYPDIDITRAEFAAIMVRGLGLKPGTGKNPFKDVSNTAWYCEFIETAYEYGLISGYSADTFGPEDKITREQAMAVIARAMNITRLKTELAAGEADSILAGFVDSELAAQWARASMASCVKTGIISGKSGKMLAPGDNITRAEVAVIVRRLLQKSNLI